MKSISLFLLRASTGIYLALWGLYKLIKTESAVSISEFYYFSLLNAETLLLAIGVLQILLGILVTIGLFRSISYIAQAAWYLAGILPILANIIDPFGLYIAEASRLTFFPSTTLLFASLIVIAFKEYDTLSIDHKRAQTND